MFDFLTDLFDDFTDFLTGDTGDDEISALDPEYSLADTDGDGYVDSLIIQQSIDLDGDDVYESVLTEVYTDLDGNGVFESHSSGITSDFNMDGVVDYSNLVHSIDVDEDGNIDYAVMMEDLDGDFHFDVFTELFDNTDSLFTEPDYVDLDPADAPAYATYGHFDSSNCDVDMVIGDPEQAMGEWHLQETDTSCAVASQEFVLEQLIPGQDFDEADLRDLAEGFGWYDPDGGTSPDDVGNILEYMGLDVERSTGNSISDIEQCLQDGGQVIVSVDSSEIWTGENNDFFAPGIGADHAIQVIGIDRSDPADPMVIVNDSGAANGCGALVPLDTFVDAWEDGGCFMVEAYA